MLIGSARRRLLAFVVAAATLVSVTFLATSSASAEVVQICNKSGTCWWKVVTPGQSSFPGMPGGGGGGGPRMCMVPANSGTTVQPPGLAVPCYDPDFGYLDSLGCYHRKLSPQPPASDPVWRGNYPNGAIWYMTCPWGNFGGGNSGTMWRESAPPQAGAMPTAAELAAAAIAELMMVAPIIGIVPEPAAGNTGLVGLPVWMWSQDPNRTFTADWATAGVPGLAVRADSTPLRIVWNMGNGDTKPCGDAGREYTDADGLSMGPCSYRYAKAGSYTISATTTWQIEWRTTAGPPEGASFTYSLTTTLPNPIVINELQVVTG
jgi:hypothetical protein